MKKETKESGSATAKWGSVSYPGVVRRRQDDVLAAELLEELCVVLLLGSVRTAQDLLEGRRRGAEELQYLKQLAHAFSDSVTIPHCTNAGKLSKMIFICLQHPSFCSVLFCFLSLHCNDLCYVVMLLCVGPPQGSYPTNN